MYRNSIIHTSDNILVIAEELAFIYFLIDVSRHDYLSTIQRNTAEQQYKANKQDKEADNKRHQNSAKKRALSEYCQMHNRNAKY